MSFKRKSHKGASKRFRPTASSFKFRHTNRSHMNAKMTAKRKRHLSINGLVDSTNMKKLNFSLH